LDTVRIDELVVFFGLVYYAILFLVFLLRARELTRLEWKISPIFSALLVPFCSLFGVNLYIGKDVERLITELPLIIYLGYDLWYRAITKKKPYHHPKRWPIGLTVYVLLLFAGSIGLNWYGYLVSQFYGNMLVAAFFVMMGSFGYYQREYNKEKKAKEGKSISERSTPI
jgi:hypothetical protein